MMSSIREHRKSVKGFAVGAATALLVSGGAHAAAQIIIAVGAVQGESAYLTHVKHSAACVKIAGDGTATKFANGVKNTSTSSVDLACPIETPPGGWLAAGSDGYLAGADVNDQNDNSGGIVTVSSCYLNRVIAGAGCGATQSTSGTTDAGAKGLYGVTVGMPTSSDNEYASRYVLVRLPPVDGAAASLVRDFGYNDNIVL